VGTGLIVEGGACKASADRVSTEKSCGDIGQPLAGKFGTHIESLSAMGGQCPGDRTRFHERKDGASNGGREQHGPMSELWNGERRETGRNRSEVGNQVQSLIVECEHFADNNAADHRDNRRRNPPVDTAQACNKDECGDGKGYGQQVSLGKACDPRCEYRYQVTTAYFGASRIRELSSGDQDCCASDIATHDWVGNVIRHIVEPQHPGKELHDTDKKRQRNSDFDW
jgi:hypothetical protein